MPTSITSRMEVQFTSGVWTALAAGDVVGEIRCRRGIIGNGPTDNVAATGELRFNLDNSLRNAGATLGWYSPAFSGVRSGWTYGIAVRWFLYYESALAASSITRTGSTATVTTSAAHGLSTNNYVLIAGADQADYNGVYQITVVTTTTFTYTVANSPVTPATGTITATRGYVVFRGKVQEILPDAGQYQERLAHVIAYDAMRDLIDASAREVAIQVSQNENQLITALVTALPTNAQPPATSYDAGIDTYTYAYDKLGPGTAAATALKDVILSGLGALYVTGDGTLRYKTRRNRALVNSQLTLSNTMLMLTVPSSLRNVYNRVRATVHPKTVDAAATTVLYSQTGTAPSIGPSASITVWGAYRDPAAQTSAQVLIGGTGQVTPIVSTTDYTGNTAADGTGTDKTSQLSITTTAFASVAKFVITNNDTGTVYLTKLQIRGKGIYDTGPRTLEGYTAKSYGDRPVDVNMPYQDDPSIGQEVADYLNAQFNNLSQQVEAVEFNANTSTALAGAALAREVTDAITLTETVSGLSATTSIIQEVELRYQHSKDLVCRWGLSPAPPFSFWLLGNSGQSELGTTSVLGF